MVARVSPKFSYQFKESRAEWGVTALDPRDGGSAPSGRDFHVVAYDYGAKRNILRCLVDNGFKVTVVPANTSAEAALALNPDGIFLSNGPGDPAALPYAVESVRGLLGKKPIFGICLGHQLLARALGASTYKLKFGHRGLNQPVKDLTTQRVEITTQNHGFVVDVDSLKGVARSTHLHLNDGSSEGPRGHGRAGFQCAVSPGSRGRSARCLVPLRSLPPHDGPMSQAVDADRTIHFVSLGCPKNRVDSEVMLGVAERAGYRHVAEAEDAAVIVVKHLRLHRRRQEGSIDTILELSGYKDTGACQKLSSPAA